MINELSILLTQDEVERLINALSSYETSLIDSDSDSDLHQEVIRLERSGSIELRYYLQTILDNERRKD
jgi:hypothetical protein